MTDASYSVPTLEKHRFDWFPYLVGGVTIIVLFAFLILPILFTVLGAFIPQGQPWALDQLSLVNFQRFFAETTYRSALVNSIVVAVLSTVSATALALPAAFAVSRVRIPFRNLILALSVIPLVAPPFIGAYSWIVLLGRNGIVTHFIGQWFGIAMPPIYGMFGVVLALSLSLFPFIFLIVQGALSASDPSIEESAQIMGASRWRIFRTITLPLMTPAIAAAAMIVFVKALGNFGVPAILGGEMYVLPTLIYFQIHGFFNLNGAAAIALVNVLVTVAAILVLAWINRRRRFVTVTGTTRRARRLESLGARIVANAYVWTLLFATLLPQMIVVWASFAERWAATLFPTAYGLVNYRNALVDLFQSIENSLLLAGGATAMTVIFGTLLAYTSVRRRFVGKWAIDMTVMMPFVLPGVVTGVAFLVTFNSGPIALTGTATILILAYFVRRIAYVFRSVSAAISQVDPRIEEASTVCGASWGMTMRRVIVPLVAPGILAGAIIVFATLISEMNVTILLYSARWKTIAVAIYERLLDDDLPIASAIGSVTIALTLLLVFAASKLIGRTMADMFK